MMKPATPAMRPWFSACLPSVAETCEAEMSSSLIGRAPVLSRLASCWAESIVKPPEIRDPLAAAEAVGVLVPVDLRDRDQLVVQRDGEVLVGRRRPARRARTPGRAGRACA